MREALTLAEAAFNDGEVPVGAVIVCGGEIIAAGRNRRERSGDAVAHAEIEAIRSACERRKNWRLNDCTLYVTMEPCAMCAGAAINARVGRIVFGAYEDKTGSCGSVCNLFAMPFSHSPNVTGGILAEECAGLMSAFFNRSRNA